MEDAEGDAEKAAVDKKVNHINKYCKKEYLLHNFSDWDNIYIEIAKWRNKNGKVD